MATLADVFASVEVSASDGALILQDFLQNNSDRSPTLVASLQTAIGKVLGQGEPEPEPTKTSTSSSSASSTTKVT